MELEAAEAALAREASVPALLAAACRQLVELLGASACAISRIVGEMLVDVAEHSRSGERLALGYGYLLPDYPLTQEVVERREPRSVSLIDAEADPQEAALLRELGFESLLMVPLVAGGRVWALVEIYDNGRRFGEGDAQLALRLVERAGELLEALDRA